MHLSAIIPPLPVGLLILGGFCLLVAAEVTYHRVGEVAVLRGLRRLWSARLLTPALLTVCAVAIYLLVRPSA